MYFSRVELKRLCEIFTRMFADPHSKVRPQSLGLLSCLTVCAHLTLFQDEWFVFLPLPSAGENWHLKISLVCICFTRRGCVSVSLMLPGAGYSLLPEEQPKPFRGHFLEPEVQFDLHFSRVYFWWYTGKSGPQGVMSITVTGVCVLCTPGSRCLTKILFWFS